MATPIEPVHALVHNWWALLVRGIAAILFGILAYAWPGITFTILVLLFGVYALWDGVFASIAAFRSHGHRRWALALEGLAGIIAGLVAIVAPGIAGFALLYVIAAWAIVTGVFEIAAAIRLREQIHGEWLLFVVGVLSVLFGIAIALRPGAGVLAVTWIIAAYAIVFGVLLSALAFRLRNWKRTYYEATRAAA